MVEFHRIPLHQSGPYKGLPMYEPKFDQHIDGSRVTLKLEVVIHNPGKHLCVSAIDRKQVALAAEVSPSTKEVTVMFAKMTKGKNGFVITPDEHSHVLELHPVSCQTMLNLKELCTGVGGLGVGAEYSGFRVTACVEKQPKFCELLSQLTHASVVPGDMSWLSTVKQLHQADPTASVLGMGFNCQSFSRAGDQHGGYDPRAMTLPWGLWVGYVLDCPIVVLECVSEAPSFPFVRRCLEQYQVATKACLSEVILQLNEVWPSARKRWWSVLAHQSVGQVPLEALPKLSRSPVVSDVLPCFQCKTDDILKELLLTESEKRQLHMLGTDMDKCTVSLHECLPTALHSWANQLIPCSCECRLHPLGGSRLRDRGFFGSVIKCVDDRGHVEYRHPSASEVGLLVGFPKALGIHASARLEVAAMGQIASPLQSTWIFSQVRVHLASKGIGKNAIFPVQEGLRNLMTDLLELRDREFGGHRLATQAFRQMLVDQFGVSPAAPSMTGASETKVENEEDVRMDQALQAMCSGGEDKQTAVTEDRPRKRPRVSSECLPGAVPGFAWNASPTEALTEQDSRSEDTMRQRSTIAMPEAKEEVAEDGADEQAGHQSSVVDQIQVPGGDPVHQPEVDVPEGDQSETIENAPVPEGEVEVPRVELPDGFSAGYFDDVGFGPRDILCEHVIMCDVENSSAYAVQTNDATTVQMLLRAHCLARWEMYQVSTLGGVVLNVDDTVRRWKCVIVAPKDDAVNVGYHAVMQRIRSLPRWLSCMMQGGWVADDEMRFMLSGFQLKGFAQVIEPLILQMTIDWELEVRVWFDRLLEFSEGIVVSAILHADHWIPVIVRFGEEIGIHTTHEGRQVLETYDSPVAVSISTEQMYGTIPHDCGFQVVGWLAAHLGLPNARHVMDHATINAWRMLWLQQVLMHQCQEDFELVAIGGHPEELTTAISAMLREHGVEAAQVQSRAAEVINKLGKEELRKAIHSSRPWAQIKQLANRHSPPVQLIMPSELDKVIKDRQAKSGHFGKQSNKMKTGGGPRELNASDLHVPPGVFVLADGTPVHQVELRQIKRSSHGIVICQESEVAPMQSQFPLTEGGLLLLVINPSEEFVKQHGAIIRFPAQCTSTAEPVLVSAVQVQAGKGVVSRARPSSVPQVCEVKVITIKLLWYRDQCPVPWQEVIEAPVKQLMTKVKCLTECKQSNCSCEAWHRGATMDPHDQTEPIMDLWNRDFLSVHFRKARPADADMFVCQMRVREDRFHLLTQMVGQYGIYVEPRSPDGRQQNSGWQTVWLPKHDLQAAAIACAKSPQNTFVIRVNKRYGLKVLSGDAASVHQSFRSDVPFLGEGDTSLHQIGPLPWGTSRSSLQQLFASWSWTAVPLQPLGRAACNRGLLWVAKATAPPASSVITMAHADIIIVKKDNEVSKSFAVPQVEASVHTKHKLTTDDFQDPWADAASQLRQQKSQSAADAPVSQKQLQNLEQRLVQQIKEVVKPDGDSAMDGSEWEPRVKALEAQVASIGESQQQQIQQTQTLQQQVDGQGQALRQHLDMRLGQHMDRIEALLNKRAKTAGAEGE
eukprot:Skav206282  [mRNA]  locus=scaffold922:138713:143392:- [translate_table: standard]